MAIAGFWLGRGQDREEEDLFPRGQSPKNWTFFDKNQTD